MQLPETIVFDLDGTLIDSADDLCGALNHLLVELGRAPPLSRSEVRSMIGDGSLKLVERALAAQPGPAVDLADHLLGS